MAIGYHESPFERIGGVGWEDEPSLTHFQVRFDTEPDGFLGFTMMTALNFSRLSPEISSNQLTLVTADLPSAICGLNAHLVIPAGQIQAPGEGFPDVALYWVTDTVFRGQFVNYSFPDRPGQGDTVNSLPFASCPILHPSGSIYQ